MGQQEPQRALGERGGEPTPALAVTSHVAAQLIQLRGEFGVVLTQHLQDVNDVGEPCLVVRLERSARGEENGKDHGSCALARVWTHHPAHGLHDVDQAPARVGEDDGVEGGNVHALGQTANVGGDHRVVRAGLIELIQNCGPGSCRKRRMGSRGGDPARDVWVPDAVQ